MFWTSISACLGATSSVAGIFVTLWAGIFAMFRAQIFMLFWTRVSMLGTNIFALCANMVLLGTRVFSLRGWIFLVFLFSLG